MYTYTTLLYLPRVALPSKLCMPICTSHLDTSTASWILDYCSQTTPGDDVNPYFPLTFPFRVVCVYSIGLATKWSRILSLDGIEKIRNHLIAKPIDGTFDAFAGIVIRLVNIVRVEFASVEIHRLIFNPWFLAWIVDNRGNVNCTLFPL